MLMLLLGLAVISAGAYFALQGGVGRNAEPPRRQLDNVRQSAARLEAELQQQVTDLEKKTAE